MFKNIQRLIVALIISITLSQIGAIAYEDVDSSADYYYAVEHLRRNKVIRETRFFKPELEISKAEFIKYLVLINEPDFEAKKAIKLPYSDTKNNAWYAPYISEAIDLGILSRTSVNLRPYDRISISDALKLLFQSKSLPIPKKHVGTIPYRDIKKSKDRALLMRASILGLIQPEKNDFLGVGKRLNRAMAAKLIFKMEMLEESSSRVLEGTSSDQKIYESDLQKIINVWEIIKSNYVNQDQINTGEMSKEAIDGILKTLDDPYSNYLDKQANQNFNDEIEGKFEGIGAYISLEEDGNITIVSPIKDSPAYKAGVKPGDIIRKVDDFDTKEATLQEVVNAIKGPKGTKVTLTVERENRLVNIDVIRDTINIKAVEHEIIEDGKVMLARIITFNQGASSIMKDLAQLVSNNPKIKGMVIDLRGNPGGLLDSAIEIISLFVKKGSPAVKIKYNYYNITQSTTKDGILKDLPVVILIDKGSASASEILAGALQELTGATIVGETSFGKGTVQEVNFFRDNSSLKITVAKWLTPKGKSIQGNGITPDIEIKRGSGEEIDRQMERALIEIRNKIK